MGARRLGASTLRGTGAVVKMPSESIPPEVLRRLLAAKTLLASNAAQLTPDSDPIVVGKMVLAAHDAAELAAAAIADHLGADLSGRHYLTQYPVLIEQRWRGAAVFPGKNFLSQLDKVRTLFKHSGILPDAREWFQVIENTWKWVDSWCNAYLGLSIDEIDMEQLLNDEKVKGYYRLAKEHGDKGEHREALVALPHRSIPRVG